jgi:hypothetical protein
LILKVRTGVGDLVADLDHLGVRLVVDGSDLKYFPKRLVPPELLSRMREHKLELIQHLTIPSKPAERPGGANELSYTRREGWKWSSRRLDQCDAILVNHNRLKGVQHERFKLGNGGVPADGHEEKDSD